MQIKDKILDILSGNQSNEDKLLAITVLLENEFDTYDWVGFYFKHGDKKELKLGPYTGEETDHVIIPFGKGICGQVALSNENFVVEDVSAQDNYISCGWKVKSEIVIPIFVKGENIGQIDIDSHTVAAFKQEDEKLLEFICKEVGQLSNITEMTKK